MRTSRKIIAICTMVTVMSCKKENQLTSPCSDGIPATEIPVPFTVLSDSAEGIDCITKLVEFGPEWKEFISLDPQGSVIWPGAGLSYPSIKSGAYTPLSGDRKPITISVSLP